MSNYGKIVVLIGDYFISKYNTLEAFQLYFEELPSAKVLAKYRRRSKK